MVWMDERPLDPARVYLLKQGTRTVSAEVDHGLVLNQIGTVTVTTARPLVFDRYADNRGDGQLHPDRSGDELHRRRRHDHRPPCTSERPVTARPSAAERLARLARAAATDADAIEAVRLALEEILK